MSKSNPQRVVLTGGAGFIGSHVAEALIRRGCALTVVDCVDDFYARERKLANLAEVRKAGSFEFVERDICEPGMFDDLLGRVQPHAVVHLAARAGVRPSIENPVLYERVNIGGTLNLLQAISQTDGCKMVFGSSSSVYGVTSDAPFAEAQGGLRPISPYGVTKLAGEALSFSYAHLYRFPVVCLRFFTVYGPRQRPDLAIHKFTKLLEAGDPLPIFGDGSSGRDYTHVTDIVRGVLAAVDYTPRAGPGGAAFEIFNLGNASPVKLFELVEALEVATGREALREELPPQPGDVPLTWADLSKAERELGYRPQVTLADGLGDFVNWFRTAQQSSKDSGLAAPPA